MRHAVLAVGLAAGVACGNEPVAPDIGEEFVLSIGQSAAVAGRGITIAFEDVTEDSRCPSDVVCIHAGDAVVAVTAQSPGRSEALEVTTSGSSSVVIADGLELRLQALDPYPVSTRAIPKDDYRARLVVLARLVSSESPAND